ncbi:MAG: barstar family protein [Lachnospiraceae bacterium]|nr:barstar family protein [Lachnospiraceae bacterium]
MKAVILDFHAFDTTRAVHEYLAAHLSFPDYYGKNLDALHDCLTDLSEDVCVTVVRAGKDFEEGFLTVFADAQEENRHFFCTGSGR